MTTLIRKLQTSALAAALAICAGYVQTTQAATLSWDSIVDGNWGAATNWNPQAVPGSNFPTTIDAVELGPAGFPDTTAATRTITVSDSYTVAGLTFEGSADAQRYILDGAGVLIMDSGTTTPSTLAFQTLSGGPSHRIEVDMEIRGSLNATIPGVGSRWPVITGSIQGYDGNPAVLNVAGGGGNNASLVLLGNNDFAGGELILSSNNSVDVGSNGNAANNATIRLTGSNASLPLGINPASTKQIFFEPAGDTTYNWNKLSVEANGRLHIVGSINTDLFFQSVEIADGMILDIFRGNNSDIIFEGAGSHVTLGENSTLQVNQNNGTRLLNVYIRDGAILEGSGNLLTRRGNTNASSFPTITMGDGGTLIPSITGNTAIMKIANATDFNDTRVTMATGSTLQMAVNGPTAGTGYDQLQVNNGILTLESGVTLDANLSFLISPTAVVTLIEVADGALFSGTFDGLAEGASVELGIVYGRPATALISYSWGDSGPGSGNHVALYGFHIPEPSSFGLLLAGLAVAIRRRTFGK